MIGFGPGRFGGLTSKCLGRLGGNSPSWRNRTAFPRTAERRRCNRLAISEAEFVGHKVSSSRSSSSVQRDTIGLGHPAPGAMLADSCGNHFGDCIFQSGRRVSSVQLNRVTLRVLCFGQRDPARIWRFRHPFEKRRHHTHSQLIFLRWGGSNLFASCSLCSLSTLAFSKMPIPKFLMNSDQPPV